MVGVTIGTDNAEKVRQGFEGASIVFVSPSILRFFHLLPGSFSDDDQFLGSHRPAEGKPLNLVYTYDPPLINLLQKIDDGILMINVAKAAKGELFIWSGLMSVTKASGGKYTHVDHFNGKAAITAYGRQSSVPFVDIQAGMYASNFTGALAPRN
jgi:hypothetical protein